MRVVRSGYFAVVLSGRTDRGGIESEREVCESGRVRPIVRSTEGSAWNVPWTAVEAQVGDAEVSGRFNEGVLAPSL